jgi:4-hydroxythreonine-4-phosphate dehydrogenase
MPTPPRLAITVGDAAGIGPEIVLKALAAPDRPDARMVVYGPLAVLEERAARFGLRSPDELAAEYIDVAIEGPVTTGQVSAAAGRAGAEAVLRAVADVRAGRMDAIATAPLNKEALRAAGYPWPGHTELLAEASGVKGVAMAFVGGGLRVVLVTIHRSLRSVPDAVTTEGVVRVARLMHAALPRFGATRRLMALCGLNPHAGEHGLFGDEEERTLVPAVLALQREGIEIAGPLPADTLFPRAMRGEFDAVLALYHDQGLIPVKLAAFGQAVNVTLGLPFVRTSVDHGTAFDIVDRGVADPGSMLAALRLAAQMVVAGGE